MVSNVALNLTLYPVLGYRGVALGTSVAATVNFAVLAIAWRRCHGGLGGERVVPHLVRVLAASAVLALVAWGTARGLERALPPRGLWRQLALAFGPIALAGPAYFAASRALGLGELDEVLRLVRRRASRRSAARSSPR
jgi:putative peptidoglycan lipid II flippase